MLALPTTAALRRGTLGVLLGLAVLSPGCSCGPSDTPDAGEARDGGEGDGGEATDAGSSPDSGLPDGGSAGDAGHAADAGAADAGVSCPDAGVVESSMTVTASTQRLQGTTDGTSAGTFVVRSADGGQVLEGPVPTDNGSYDVTVPLFCGQQTVELSWPTPECTDRVRVSIERQQCSVTDLQVTLSWDALGADFELHLVRQGGRINVGPDDCTWTTCISSSPDWGVTGDSADNPHKDIDNTGAYGPENIFLNGPENLTYTVLVEHWGSGAPEASGEVTVLLKGGPTVTMPITHLASHWVDTVATIDWATKTVTPLGTFTDCTASWSSGCTLQLP